MFRAADRSREDAGASYPNAKEETSEQQPGLLPARVPLVQGRPPYLLQG